LISPSNTDDPVKAGGEEALEQARRNHKPQRRQLFCPAHLEQRIEGNGQKYFLHLLTARGMSHKRAQLVIHSYPVLVLSKE
jgi:hypothetical protein